MVSRNDGKRLLAFARRSTSMSCICWIVWSSSWQKLCDVLHLIFGAQMLTIDRATRSCLMSYELCSGGWFRDEEIGGEH